MKPLLVSVKEAAGLLGLSTATVYLLCSDDGPLEKRYIGTRNFKVVYASIEAYLGEMPLEQAKPA